MSKWGKTALLYIVLTLVGIVLYLAAHEYATAQRGYIAYGGEIFFLALPLFGYIVSTVYKDIGTHNGGNNDG